VCNGIDILYPVIHIQQVVIRNPAIHIGLAVIHKLVIHAYHSDTSHLEGHASNGTVRGPEPVFGLVHWRSLKNLRPASALIPCRRHVRIEILPDPVKGRDVECSTYPDKADGPENKAGLECVTCPPCFKCFPEGEGIKIGNDLCIIKF